VLFIFFFLSWALLSIPGSAIGCPVLSIAGDSLPQPPESKGSLLPPRARRRPPARTHRPHRRPAT
jgi:hypothetical protein